MKSRESRYKFRTVAPATLAALAAITTSCSAGATSNEHTPKAGHSASSTAIGKKPSAAKTTQPTNPTTHPSHPESSTSTVAANTGNTPPNLTGLGAVNWCNVPTVADAVKAVVGPTVTDLKCMFLDQINLSPTPGSSAIWYSGDMNPNTLQLDKGEEAAMISVTPYAAGKAPGITNGSAVDSGKLKSEPVGWNYSDPDFLNHGLTTKFEVETSHGPETAILNVYVSLGGVASTQASYSAHEKVMAPILDKVAELGNIGLGNVTVAPESAQQMGINNIPPLLN